MKCKFPRKVLLGIQDSQRITNSQPSAKKNCKKTLLAFPPNTPCLLATYVSISL